MKKGVIGIMAAAVLAMTACAAGPRACAQEKQDDALAALGKKMVETTDNEVLLGYFEDSASLFFKENKYDEYAAFLRSVREQKKELEPIADYYLALTRYSQLKHLEEAQNWELYFANGNTYREEIVVSAQKAVDATMEDDPVRLYASLVLWRFHNDQQDAFTSLALSNLITNVSAFARKNPEAEPLKAIADQLMENGEKAKARTVYKLYAQKVMSSDTKEGELKPLAEKFYNEGNLELAEALYQGYVDRLLKGQNKETLAESLKGLILTFSYHDKALSDPAFAEELFRKLEAAAGKSVFDEDLLYARAYNLEKLKDYPSSLDWYQQLLYRFPNSPRVNQATYKVGYFFAYAMGDVGNAKLYFRRLAQTESAGVYAVLSLYQLGLLSQWAEDDAGARSFYGQVLEKARNRYEEAMIMAQDRIKELDLDSPIEYNLKMFLDASLKQGATPLGSKVSLKASPYQPKIQENVNVSAAAFAGESGCMQVELQYLWSGNPGKFKPANDQAAFTTQYSSSGTKEVSLVVVSASGIVDKTFDFIDVE